MNRLVFSVVLVTIFAFSSVEGTFGTILRGFGLNGHYYNGSGVGPLWLFRSSADNAAIVNEGLKGKPIQKSFALALGDEFPKLRDDLIERAKNGSRYGAGAEADSDNTINDTDSSSSSSASTSSTGTGRASPLAPFTKFQNWRYDRNNSKNEFEHPYIRPNPLGPVASRVRSLGASIGSGSGPLSRITGLISSFASGGGSPFPSSSGSSNLDGFRISVDFPTRSPNSI